MISDDDIHSYEVFILTITDIFIFLGDIDHIALRIYELEIKSTHVDIRRFAGLC